MLLINISGILSWFIEEGELILDGNCNTTHLKKAKKGRIDPGYELGGWEPTNDLNWNNMYYYMK